MVDGNAGTACEPASGSSSTRRGSQRGHTLPFESEACSVVGRWVFGFSLGTWLVTDESSGRGVEDVACSPMAEVLAQPATANSHVKAATTRPTMYGMRCMLPCSAWKMAALSRADAGLTDPYWLRNGSVTTCEVVGLMPAKW